MIAIDCDSDGLNRVANSGFGFDCDWAIGDEMSDVVDHILGLVDHDPYRGAGHGVEHRRVSRVSSSTVGAAAYSGSPVLAHRRVRHIL